MRQINHAYILLEFCCLVSSIFFFAVDRPIVLLTNVVWGSPILFFNVYGFLVFGAFSGISAFQRLRMFHFWRRIAG
jgi:hypothetical protein